MSPRIASSGGTDTERQQLRGASETMQEKRPIPSQYHVRKKVVIYTISPTTLFGRALAFVFAMLLLVAVFFFSIVVFSILLTAVLFFLVYAWWVSRRMAQKGTRSEIDGGESPRPGDGGR